MTAKQNTARMKWSEPKPPNVEYDQFAILLSRVNEIDEDTLESHHRQPGAWTPARPETKESSMKKSTQVKNFLAILFLVMNFSSTYAEEDHDHHEGIHLLHEAMHKNRGYTQIVIGGLAYADCSQRIGVCELLYHEGHANQEAKRWGFLPTPSCLSSWLNLKTRYSLGLTINVIISIPGRKTSGPRSSRR